MKGVYKYIHRDFWGNVSVYLIEVRAYHLVKYCNKAIVPLFKEKGHLQTKAGLTAYLCAC